MRDRGPMDLHVPGLQFRRELLAAGYTSGEVQRERRAGTLLSVRRGAYVRPEDERLGRAADRHRLLVISTVRELSPDSVVSHASAAVMHGLPIWGIALDKVEVTRAASSGGRTTSGVRRHTAPLTPGEITMVDGVLVTTVDRTLADIARTVDMERAVVPADAAMRRHLVDRAALDAALVRAAGWPGIPAARRALGFANPGAASPGESRSRVAMHRFGLPEPQLQWPVVDAGTVIAETDFGWAELRTVGEFDGQVKYGRALKPGQSPGDVVFAEKVREDAVRATDLGVVRWIWDDLDDFSPVADRLRRTFRPI
jgi:hypothetical protein